jgi:hypothetical protein
MQCIRCIGGKIREMQLQISTGPFLYCSRKVWSFLRGTPATLLKYAVLMRHSSSQLPKDSTAPSSPPHHVIVERLWRQTWDAVEV